MRKEKKRERKKKERKKEKEKKKTGNDVLEPWKQKKWRMRIRYILGGEGRDWHGTAWEGERWEWGWGWTLCKRTWALVLSPTIIHAERAKKLKPE